MEPSDAGPLSFLYGRAMDRYRIQRAVDRANHAALIIFEWALLAFMVAVFAAWALSAVV